MLGSVMDRVSQTLLVDRLAIFVEDRAAARGKCGWRVRWACGLAEPLDLSFLETGPARVCRGALFFESPRAARDVSESVRRTLEQLDLNYFVPCRIREHTVAVLGLGKTVDGDFLSSDDVELVETIAGYVAIALDNSQLYTSLEQKALEIARLKDFSENIVESLNVGVLAVDLEGTVESWNTRMEQLFGVARQESRGAPLAMPCCRKSWRTRYRPRETTNRLPEFTNSACSIRGRRHGAERFHHAAGEQVGRAHRASAAV